MVLTHSKNPKITLPFSVYSEHYSRCCIVLDVVSSGGGNSSHGGKLPLYKGETKPNPVWEQYATFQDGKSNNRKALTFNTIKLL